MSISPSTTGPGPPQPRGRAVPASEAPSLGRARCALGRGAGRERAPPRRVVGVAAPRVRVASARGVRRRLTGRMRGSVLSRSASFKDPLLYDTKLTREGEKQARALPRPAPLPAALTPLLFALFHSEGVCARKPRRNALSGAAAAGVFAAAPRAAHRGAGIRSRAAAARAAAAGDAAVPRAPIPLLRRRPRARHHRRGAPHLVRGMRTKLRSRRVPRGWREVALLTLFRHVAGAGLMSWTRSGGTATATATRLRTRPSPKARMGTCCLHS